MSFCLFTELEAELLGGGNSPQTAVKSRSGKTPGRYVWTVNYNEQM